MKIFFFILLLLVAATSCNKKQEVPTQAQATSSTEGLTIGLETTVVEVEEMIFKIESEKPYRKVQDSYIIAKRADGSVEEYALPQAQLIARTSSQVKTKETEAVRAAIRGLFYHMFAGRVISSFQPKSGAYVDLDAYHQAIKDNPQLKVD